MPLKKPMPLAPGDTIRVVSPSSPLAPEKMEAGLQLLRDEGYRVELSENALLEDGYLAGPDETRAKDLQDAFGDPSVSAVFCSRGGYGAARLLPFLDLDLMARSGKMFLGYSDVTTLHLALNRRGLPTVYAPMAITLAVEREPWVYESLTRVLRGELEPPSGAPRGETIVPGLAEGNVTGGCLCLLTDSVGTPNELDCEGAILLLEDVDEAPHRVDAMLTHLLNAGIAQKASGIVVGEMTRTDEKADPLIGARPWRAIVEERLAALRVPLVVNFPVGHMRNMLTLPLGIRARLDAEKGTLTYLEALCD